MPVAPPPSFAALSATVAVPWDSGAQERAKLYSLAVAEAKSIYTALAPADLAALPGAPLPFGDKCARRQD